MEQQVKFVNLLSKERLLKDVSSAVSSPLFNLICIVSKNKDASIHLLPNSGDEPCFWQCPSKTKSCLFSEDGKHLLFLLSVNSIHIYKVDEEVVASTQQIKASALATLLKDYSIDYSAVSKVTPLKLRRSELLVEVNGRLVCLEWGISGAEPSVRYTVLLPAYSEIHLSSSKLFLLEPNSHLSVYNLADGHKCQEVLNLCLANRANADISIGRSFFKFAVDPAARLVAVVNQDEVTVLFDVSEAFDRPESKPRAGDEPKKDKWAWPGKRKSVGEGRAFPGRVLGQVAPMPGVVVSRLHFSLHGLFVFYSVMGHSSCSSFKVVEETTGQLLCAMDGLVEYSLVSGGRLPLFMSDSILSICLGALSADPFVSRLCEIIPEFGAKEIDKIPPQPVAARDNVDIYAEFMKIIFSLHSNTYRSNLKRICDGWRDEVEMGIVEKKVVERVESLCGLVLGEGRDERLIAFAFLHTVHLLDLTCLAVKTARGRVAVARLEGLSLSLMVHLAELYPHIKHRDLLRYEWMVWRSVSEQEVVQESVILGTVALALAFFTVERGWDVGGAIERFKTETKEYIVQLISVGDLEKATLALNTLGCDPIEHYRELCLETSEPLLRDLLASHLRTAERLSEEEEAAWRFCKQVETSLSTFVKSYRSFEHKMTVSATEKATIVMIKLVPFNDSINIKTVLNQPLEWRKSVITELYFVTGDVTLESQLNCDLCWEYLLETNCIDLLICWVDAVFAKNDAKPQPCDYLTKMLVGLLARWPITAAMLDRVATVDCMTATSAAVLDRAALYGVFSTTETRNMAAVVLRLRNLCLLTRVTEVLSKPTANVGLEDFNLWVLEESSKHELKIPVITCLQEANNAGELLSGEELFAWLPLWREFETWDGKELAALPNLIRMGSEIVPVSADESPYIKIALALVEGKEVVELIEEEGPSSDLLRIPQVDICWQSLERARTRPPDVTLYDLLAGSRLPVERLLAWQTENTYVAEIHVAESFPHFNHQVLSAKLGHKQHLDYLYYLKQGRPSFACNLFIVESLRAHRRLTTHMINRACGLAHGLALRMWREQAVGNASVAFIAMLGDIPTANALRLHLAAVAAIAYFLPDSKKRYIGNLTFGIVSKDNAQLQDMAGLLEAAILESVTGLEKLTQLRQWSVPVTFCNMHGLALPTLLPRALAKEKDWFHFILCLDLFKYPYELAIELIEEMSAPVLKAHLLRALTRTTLKLATTSPSKSPPRIRLEPDSGVDDLEVKDAFQTYVTTVYTEVLTTIQSFTDRNIVLPWSCEQNPDEDVLLTLLKCESEPDVGRALLLSALELQSPILALLSTCHQVENVAAPLLAWLLASVPTCLPRSRLREEALMLPLDRNFSPDLVQGLLLQFFTTGYFQTFYRGMTLFLPDNPLTFVVEAVYRCIVELDSPGALSALKAFVLEMVHGQGQVKDATLGARDWVLSTASRLVESALTRSDVTASVKLIFLKVLADSELSSVDEVFPKFLLWYQMSEILEPTQVRLNFTSLYDLQSVSGELERCLDELFAARAFPAALEISALLSLNKDRIVVATWEQNFLEVLPGGDVARLWVESAAAFKDENVNPTLISAFYYKMAGLFPTNTPDNLRNKYLALKLCLAWRKLVEDTLLPSFREESDTIELEQWEVCLAEGFDGSALRGGSVAETFALLVAQWPPPKLLVRAAVRAAPEPARVTALIAALLDAGDLQSALRVSAFFTREDQDLVTIFSCLQVALGELPPTELAKYNSLLSSPRKLLTSPVKSVADLEGLETSPTAGREPPPVLALLERLCASVAHGEALTQRICVCARLSFALDIPFQQLAAETDCLELLERAVAADGGSKVAVARDVLWLAGMPDVALAQFLAERIVRAISVRLLSGLDVPARLWDVSLDEGFHHIVALMDNPTLLGLELLNASVQLPLADGVEVLIRAHDCYTITCNVEGIGLVLRRARVVALLILQAHHWRHLVRLLVGIGRYGDMAYIFQMLKDNDQFEYLLRKGTVQAPGLQLAVVDFLQRTCPENRELAKLVALAFGLHGRQADIYQTEADEMVAQMQPPLKDTSKVRQALTLAMENYSNAATFYLEAGKMNKALKIAKQAQVVALQMSLLGGPFILNVKNQSQLQALAQDTLSVANVLLMMKTRDLQVDWSTVLHERWVIHGDKTVFNELKAANILTPLLVSRYLQRYDKEQTLGSRAKDRMKQVAALLPNPPTSLLKKPATSAMRV